MQIYIWVVWVFAWIRHEGVKPEIYLNPATGLTADDGTISRDWLNYTKSTAFFLFLPQKFICFKPILMHLLIRVRALF